MDKAKKRTKAQNRRYYLHRRIKKQFHVEPHKREIHIPFDQFETKNYLENPYMYNYLTEIAQKYNYAVLSVFV